MNDILYGGIILGLTILVGIGYLYIAFKDVKFHRGSGYDPKKLNWYLSVNQGKEKDGRRN